MANRDLLKEAIADAKALKETAIANAKVALEEAFEPRLKSMLSAKLEEMEKEDLEEGDDEMTEAKKKYKDDDRKDGGESKETKRTEKMKYGKDLAEAEDMDEEMDLDEILAELEGDLSEDERTDAEEEGYEDGMEDEKEDMEDDEEDEEIDLDDLSEEDLKSFIEDVIADMVTAGELEAGEEFEVEDEDVEDDEEIDVEDDTEVDVEVNEAKEEIDEADAITGLSDMAGALAMAAPALAAILGLGVAAVKDKLEKGGKEAKELVAKANAKAKSIGEDARTDAEEEGYLDGMKDEKEDMDEMKKEIEELRSDLHETNLLNAKLLYTNKIFRAKNLKEAQKVKVLEAFDKASNVKEVKLIFETLNEGMVSKTATPIRENLGSASKASGVAKKAPIMEIDPQVARWQKLAGLK
jgi:F0F1-type ATP synthase membrane subunit b/b'